MNFGEKEDFFERHRYFFDGYSFKFEGLSSEKEKELVNTVKKLSGDVSNDADYTLCESSYFKKQKQHKIDYYAVEFINHCISKNTILDINEYRLCEDKENYGDIIQSVNNNESICNEVEELEQVCHKEIKENVQSKNKISFLKKEKSNYVINWRKRKTTIKRTEKVIKVIDLSSDELIEVPLNNNDSAKKIKILDPLSINSKFKEQKNLAQSSNEAGPSHQPKTTTKGCEDTNDEVSIVRLSESLHSTTSSPSTTSSKPSRPLSSSDDDDNDDDNDNNDDDDNHNDDTIIISNKNKWWHTLPKQFNLKVYDKDRSRNRRGATFTKSEQRLMIAFLINYKLIRKYSAASRAPWEMMHTKGYLLHRTVESLSNNYRRSILPNISKYKLPKVYEKEFLLSRRK